VPAMSERVSPAARSATGAGSSGEDCPAAGRDAGTVRVPRDRLLHDWGTAHARARAYLEALDLPAAACDALAGEAVERALGCDDWSADGSAVSETLRALRTLLPERVPHDVRAGDACLDRFLAWRLEAALERRVPPDGTTASDGLAAPRRTSPWRDGRFRSTPPLRRAPFVPGVLQRRQRRPQRPAGAVAALPPRRRRDPGWTRVALRRRLLLAVLVLVPTVIASGFMADVLPRQGTSGLEAAIVGVFGALFGWISIGFWTALIGFFVLLSGRDRFAITRLDPAAGGDAAAAALDPGARTALVMPICAEPVQRVFAGLRAIERSLGRAGALKHFDIFVLSDTRDPAVVAAEEEAWFDWGRAVDGFDRIFYRHRRVPLRRKSGNVADFFRRWGTRYRYVVMLDADSVMSGETLVRLVRMMERYPDVGMIQTAPVAVSRRSLLARVQQFAARIYGPMFAAGLHYWQLGDGQYWGHNAIIRAAPFLAHCGLPRLSGSPPFGGEILSHDFVEAALMGRAGWTLWLAYDLPGSWEEVPSTLLEEMKRDRRWCQGNLQHLRLLFTQGLFGAHRALFVNGVLSYVSAALWFGFLSLSTAEAIRLAIFEPEYFPTGRSLFPSWPVWRPAWAIALLAATGLILFLPKLLAVVLIAARRRAPAFGGVARLIPSVLLEIVLSSLLAPIRMTFHTRFVFANLIGHTVTWRSQEREDEGTGWREAVAYHGFDTVWATAWGVSLYWLSPHYFWWVTPIVAALVLSIPLSVLTSRASLGDRARARGLFVIPEEVAPPVELRDVEELQRAARAAAAGREPDGFVRAATDPYLSAVHRALRGPARSLAAPLRAARDALVARAVADGPDVLGVAERRVLCADARSFDELHRGVWAEPAPACAERWLRVESAAT
jgi:membrane glycosyltransferase